MCMCGPCATFKQRQSQAFLVDRQEKDELKAISKDCLCDHISFKLLDELIQDKADKATKRANTDTETQFSQQLHDTESQQTDESASHQSDAESECELC